MRGRFTSGRILKAGGWLLLVTILFAAMLALLFSPLPYPPKSKGRLLGSTEFEFMKFVLVALTALFAFGFYDAAKRFIRAVTGEKADES